MVVGKPSSFFTVLFLLLLLGSSGASLELSEDEIIGLILLSAAFGDDCSATGGLVVASISFNDGMVHVVCYLEVDGKNEILEVLSQIEDTRDFTRGRLVYEGYKLTSIVRRSRSKC